MNKLNSFWASFFMACFAALCAINFKVPNIHDEMGLICFLIYWSMIWKLFHDKNKDI